MLKDIQSAIEGGRFLKFQYRIYTGKKDTHVVKPASIARSGEAVSVNGYCHSSNQVRSFDLRKMSKVAFLDRISDCGVTKFPRDYIDQAIREKKWLYFHYKKGNVGKSCRSIKPTHYEKYKGVNVVSGHDNLTGEIRHFAPQRMTQIEILEAPRSGRVISGTP